jgi:hypothetical protein
VSDSWIGGGEGEGDGDGGNSSKTDLSDSDEECALLAHANKWLWPSAINQNAETKLRRYVSFFLAPSLDPSNARPCHFSRLSRGKPWKAVEFKHSSRPYHIPTCYFGNLRAFCLGLLPRPFTSAFSLNCDPATTFIKNIIYRLLGFALGIAGGVRGV